MYTNESAFCFCYFYVVVANYLYSEYCIMYCLYWSDRHFFSRATPVTSWKWLTLRNSATSCDVFLYDLCYWWLLCIDLSPTPRDIWLISKKYWGSHDLKCPQLHREVTRPTHSLEPPFRAIRVMAYVHQLQYGCPSFTSRKQATFNMSNSTLSLSAVLVYIADRTISVEVTILSSTFWPYTRTYRNNTQQNVR